MHGLRDIQRGSSILKRIRIEREKERDGKAHTERRRDRVERERQKVRNIKKL